MQNEINLIIDVRSTPYSQHTPQFNKENLYGILSNNNIQYLYLGNAIGGRYTASDLLYPDGKVNYSKVSELGSFKEGIARVKDILRSENHACLLCSERDPLICHRFALISRALKQEGVVVEHILSEAEIISQDQLEKRMLKKYNTNPSPLDKWIPVTNSTSVIVTLDKAYELHGREIAYRVQNKGDD